MADVMTGLKKALMKSMEAIGATAGSIASSTKVKVNEMNLVNRRREILQDFGAQAYAMWQKGEHFPEELEKQLVELSEVDAELNTIRTERLANVKTGADKPEEAEMADAEVPAMEEPAAAEAPAEAETDLEEVPTMEAPAAPDAAEALTPEVHVPDPASVPTLDLGEEKPETETDQPKADASCPDMDQLLDKARQFTQKVSDVMQDPATQQKVNGTIDAIGQTMTKMGDAIDKAVGNLADAMDDHKDDSNG